MRHLIFSRPFVFVSLWILFAAPLAAQQTAPPPPVDPAEGGAAVGDPVRVGPVTFSGGTWVESVFTTGDDPNRPVDTFRIRRARLSMAGNVAPRIGWNIGGEFSGSPGLRVAFVLFRLWPHLNIRLGQATPPSGLERSTNPLMSETIERSLATLRLTHTLDQGITIMTEQPHAGWLSYAFSVVNGTGFNRPDDNRSKDVVGRIRLTPPPVRGLVVNASAATGEQLNGRRTRATLGAQYEIPEFKLGMEGMRQTLDDEPPSEGFVVFGAVRLRPDTPTPHFRMLEFGARFFIFKDATTSAPPADEDAPPAVPGAGLPDTVREIHAGVNYDVNRNVRIMGNVLLPVDDRPAGATFLTRLQIVF